MQSKGWKNWIWSGLIYSALLSSTASVQAQLTGNGLPAGVGMDLQLFRPAMDSKGYLSVNGSDVLGHLDFSFGLIVSGGFGLIPFDGFRNDRTVSAMEIDKRQRCPNNILCGRAVDYIFTGILHGNLGIGNFLEVGVQIPLAFASGPNLTIPGVLNDYAEGRDGQGIAYQGFGNIVLHSKARLLRADRHRGFGLGLGLLVEFPTSGEGSRRFVGDNTLSLQPLALAEYRADRHLRFGLQVGARLMFGRTPIIPVGGRSEINPNADTDPNEPGIQPPTNASCATRGQVTDCIVRGGSEVNYGPMLTYGIAMGLRLGDSPLELTAEVYGASLFQSMGASGG
ncbi:MAG: hypothetical protein N2515_03430, partial [Deltaproteobacteria bacterium]|nr:hypothetical protein [Deltaproteobacteria bacterium]